MPTHTLSGRRTRYAACPSASAEAVRKESPRTPPGTTTSNSP
ncbi:hypothetical protein [Coprobacter secundus]|nr:hypothetical protein [Coprobacter secundus]